MRGFLLLFFPLFYVVLSKFRFRTLIIKIILQTSKYMHITHYAQSLRCQRPRERKEKKYDGQLPFDRDEHGECRLRCDRHIVCFLLLKNPTTRRGQGRGLFCCYHSSSVAAATATASTVTSPEATRRLAVLPYTQPLADRHAGQAAVMGIVIVEFAVMLHPLSW